MEKTKLEKIKPLDESKRYPVDASPMSLPTIYVNSEQMPEVADWEVGKKYRVLIEVEQKSKSETAVNGGKQIIDARFNIVAYKAIEGKKVDDMTDEEFGKDQDEKLEEASKE